MLCAYDLWKLQYFIFSFISGKISKREEHKERTWNYILCSENDWKMVNATKYSLVFNYSA